MDKTILRVYSLTGDTEAKIIDNKNNIIATFHGEVAVSNALFFVELAARFFEES